MRKRHSFRTFPSSRKHNTVNSWFNTWWVWSHIDTRQLCHLKMLKFLKIETDARNKLFQVLSLLSTFIQCHLEFFDRNPTSIMSTMHESPDCEATVHTTLGSGENSMEFRLWISIELQIFHTEFSIFHRVTRKATEMQRVKLVEIKAHFHLQHESYANIVCRRRRMMTKKWNEMRKILNLGVKSSNVIMRWEQKKGSLWLLITQKGFRRKCLLSFKDFFLSSFSLSLGRFISFFVVVLRNSEPF